MFLTSTKYKDSVTHVLDDGQFALKQNGRVLYVPDIERHI